jgi:hypothetical protein
LAELDEAFVENTPVVGLSLLRAGRLDRDYQEKLSQFDWPQIFDTWPTLFTKFAEHFANRFDYVLIDSRTGLTDTAGICTALLPEKLVLVFTVNSQSIEGCLEVAPRIIQMRARSHDLRPLLVYPLPSRVDEAEAGLVHQWRSGYQRQFEALFETSFALDRCDLTRYFNEVQIPYTPYFAFGEEIAVQSESEGKSPLAQAYERFAQRLVDHDLPWE